MNLKKSKIMKSIAKRISLIAAISLVTVSVVKGQDGAELYKAKCAACHSVGANRLVGPGLAGINEKRSQEWLVSWIKDSQAFIASGDADAIAIFEEYNKSPMIPFTDMSDEEIIAVLDYVKSESPSDVASEETAVEDAGEEMAVVAVEVTADDIKNGELLFTGAKRFKNGGPSCITCHNVTNDNIMAGGLLAKDLTNVHERLGNAGVVGIVSAPPFPAMVTSYGNNPIEEDEVMQLAAFFSYADKVSENQNVNDGYIMFAGGGIAGLIIILIIISILWAGRKKGSTKDDYFVRHVKGNDSVES